MIRLDKARLCQISSDNFLTSRIRFVQVYYVMVYVLENEHSFLGFWCSHLPMDRQKTRKQPQDIQKAWQFTMVARFSLQGYLIGDVIDGNFFHLGELTDVNRNFGRRWSNWKNCGFPKKFGWILDERIPTDSGVILIYISRNRYCLEFEALHTSVWILFSGVIFVVDFSILCIEEDLDCWSLKECWKTWCSRTISCNWFNSSEYWE